MAPEERGFLGERKVHTSFLQHLPFVRRHYRNFLPLMPLAVESFDLSDFDLVISSSSCAAKGVLTGPDQTHISYIHSPMRYAWDLQHQYLREAGLERGPGGLLVRAMLGRLRNWDYRTASSVDRFIANSQFVARRVWKAYRRESAVVYPPVDTSYFHPSTREREDFYLTASRMVPYKCMGLVIDAFSQLPDRRLVVIGDGPEFARLKSRAGRNVELLGYQPGSVVRDHMQHARAFVFAALEDFGIAPVEAQACGTPVIAYGRGGVTESVIPGKTGVLFEQQTVESLVGAIRLFEARAAGFDPAEIRANALRFSAERFRHQFRANVEGGLSEHARIEMAAG
jgi:glycosyltransferase involved in cell wall biosynthesis